MSGADPSPRNAALADLGLAAAGLAHEVRNALNVMRNCAYLLRRRVDAGDPAVARPLELLDAQIESCRRLVEGALDLARGPGGAPRDVPLAAAVRDALDGLPVPAHVTLRADLPDPGVQARLDPDLLARVVRELVQNAVGALGGRPGTIGVHAAAGPGGTVLEVVDDGPGFDPADAEALFEPFRTGRTGGTGLGLALARAWVRAAGGTIEARGMPGAGAAFTVRLPRGD